MAKKNATKKIVFPKKIEKETIKISLNKEVLKGLRNYILYLHNSGQLEDSEFIDSKGIKEEEIISFLFENVILLHIADDEEYRKHLDLISE